MITTTHNHTHRTNTHRLTERESCVYVRFVYLYLRGSGVNVNVGRELYKIRRCEVGRVSAQRKPLTITSLLISTATLPRPLSLSSDCRAWAASEDQATALNALQAQPPHYVAPYVAPRRNLGWYRSFKDRLAPPHRRLSAKDQERMGTRRRQQDRAGGKCNGDLARDTNANRGLQRLASVPPKVNTPHNLMCNI